MSTVTPASETPAQVQNEQRKRGCLFYIGRGLKWFFIILVTLIVLGVGYQTIATELDKRNFSPRGQLYTVNGHQMHMVCMGEGSPTVILQGGASADALWWHRVQNQLAESTQVCAYDRPGMGWSEPVEGSRDGLAIASELHALLEAADVSAPYVVVGHSFGAVWSRIYAAQYPQEVIGIVLVDSTIVHEPFTDQSEFDQWKQALDALNAPFWVMYRLGIARLTEPGAVQQAGYPSDIAFEVAALKSRNQVFDAYYAETVQAMRALAEQAAAAEEFGELPMVVLWASLSATAHERYSDAREETGAYSSNSVTRVIDGADHLSLLGNEQYAQQVSDAILDVIAAAQTGEPLTE
jgi:pimeloyl-ACP methyl ester carboxylesterase